MQLFYNPDITTHSKHIIFNRDESRHIIKVLRKVKGDKLHITNGLGYLFLVEIVTDEIKKCEVEVLEVSYQSPKPYSLHLAVAPTKLNDRFEWFLEKATEIGVTEITPIICENSERKTVKLERYSRVIISALKQSLGVYLPKLNPPILFSEFIKQTHITQQFIAHCEKVNKTQLQFLAKSQIDTLVCIGPEGDFSSAEIKEALDADFKAVALGNTRLRTETAAIVACSTINLINQSL